MIRMSKAGALLVALCAVLAAGASAGAASTTATAAAAGTCATLLPDSLLASYLPEIYGRPTKLKYDDVYMQSWTAKKNGKTSSYHTLGSSLCTWGSEGWVDFYVWYAPHPGVRMSDEGSNGRMSTSSSRGPFAAQAWALYTAGTNTQLRSQTGVEVWCSGGVPVDGFGFDSRDCAMQPVSGIGVRAAEGLGYIVFQEKGNTYMIKGKVANVQCVVDDAPAPVSATCPAGATAPIVPYATLEALARKIGKEVAASPPPRISLGSG